MDIQPQTTQPISDDQELAKVLAGVSQQADEALQFEETPPSLPGTPVSPITPATPPVAPLTASIPDVAPVVGYTPPASSDNLDDIKKDALVELRPLVDKLELSPEEKFDTYLLLIRSTDDKTLVPAAHAAAKSITDETRRAQALLDVIREIDFLSNPTAS